MADIHMLAAGHRGWAGCLSGILRAGATVVVLWAGGAMAQDLTNVAPFTNSTPYNGNVLSNTSTITNNTATGYWSGNIVTNAGTITNDAAATWQGTVLSNSSQLANYGFWLDGDIALNTAVIRNFAGASWAGDITENRSQIFNHLGATWQGDILTIGSSGTQYNWGNWLGDIWDNAGTVYNDGDWTGDILDNRKDIVNGLDPNYSSLWVGDVLGNSSYILNYLNGRWQGDVIDNAGDIANYADWTGDLTNRGRVINFGVWTGNVVQTSTFFWAENQIVGNFDNRGQLQLIGDLDITGLLTNSGRLQLTHDTGLQTLSVGSALFTPTSSYEIDVTAIGGNDGMIVTGAASLGGSVQVTTSTTGGGTFDEQKSYIILSAGSLSGSFSAVTTDLAFLSPHLSYDANNVILGLRRNDVGFAATGATGNQVDVGAAVQALGASNPIYDAVLWLTPAQAQNAFDQLSGEAIGSSGRAAIEGASLVGGLALSRLDQADSALGDTGDAVSGYAGTTLPLGNAQGEQAVWARAYGAGAKSSGGVGALNAQAGGLVLGTDGLLGGWRLGALLHLGATANSVPALNATINSTDYGTGLYAGSSWGATSLSLGGIYTLHDTQSSRTVAFPGFTDTLSAGYQANTAQAFAELSHEFDLGEISLTPYAGLSQVRYASNGFSERGGPAALTQPAQVLDATFVTLGLNADRSFVVGGDMLLMARASLGWRHGFASNPASANVLIGAPAFAVTAAPAASDLALFSAGLTLDVNAATNLDLSYDGQFSRDTQTHAIKATWAVQF